MNEDRIADRDTGQRNRAPFSGPSKVDGRQKRGGPAQTFERLREVAARVHESRRPQSVEGHAPESGADAEAKRDDETSGQIGGKSDNDHVHPRCANGVDAVLVELPEIKRKRVRRALDGNRRV